MSNVLTMEKIFFLEKIYSVLHLLLGSQGQWADVELWQMWSLSRAITRRGSSEGHQAQLWLPVLMFRCPSQMHASFFFIFPMCL